MLRNCKHEKYEIQESILILIIANIESNMLCKIEY